MRIAIFRLILPEALFRLCGGRVENLGELQATAVKAGLNGVMMGNFLTTLGNEPETDREMFEELGLNVALSDARAPDDLDSALQALDRQRVEVMIVLQTSIYRPDGKLAAIMTQTQMVLPREQASSERGTE